MGEGFKQTLHKVRKASNETFYLIKETLLFENRVEKETAQSFIGSLASFTQASCIGYAVKLLFFPPPSWMDIPTAVITALGMMFGFFIALTSWQECTIWLIPDGSSKSPYILFFPSISLLLLGATMILTVPLALLSSFVLAYGRSAEPKLAVPPVYWIQLFYFNFLLRLFFQITQKAAALCIKRRNKQATHVNKMRMVKYSLMVIVSTAFLVFSIGGVCKRCTFTFIPSLLIWSGLITPWWEKADKGKHGWKWATIRSIILLPTVYGFISLLLFIFI